MNREEARRIMGKPDSEDNPEEVDVWCGEEWSNATVKYGTRNEVFSKDLNGVPSTSWDRLKRAISDALGL
jgi:hypothetical protein